MKKFLLVSLLTASAGLFAQQEFSSFVNTGHGGATTFATDYQAVGINPANLGWAWKFDKRKFALGFTEFTGSLYSEALKKDELRDVLSDLINSGGTKFSYQEKIAAGQKFAQTGFTMNMDMGTVGAALTTKHAGGFGFRMNDHFTWYCKLGSTASDLLFLGKTSSLFDSLTIELAGGGYQNIANHPNLDPDTAAMVLSGFTNAPKLISKILDSSEISMTYYRDYNLSYGRRIFGDSLFALFGGIGVKYIQGIALLEVKSEGGKLSGYSSLSPAFGIDYGTAALAANSVTGSSGIPKSVGSGFGFDFGVNVMIKNKLKIGAAVINVGSIKWTGNVYEIKDTLMMSTTNAGLNNYNIFSQLDDMFGTKGGLFRLVGQKSKTTSLPGMMRAGASIVLGRVAEIGVDCIVPMDTEAPGNIKKPIIGFGGDVYLAPWVKFQAGFITGGNYDFQIPVGIIFMAPGGKYEGGIASRDAITFFTQNGPTISLSMGFLRMRF